ncbi:hypothetical protein CDL15_Pgr021582 [Punica granatum]|uniref:Uncharacterized protein n=1 Tax=Punica granatum TaxID=22663 RepID=A0A218WSG3_PUNGR|nr:hypothetical protein CDL15_Pgr021582 [Punica granatum]
MNGPLAAATLMARALKLLLIKREKTIERAYEKLIGFAPSKAVICLASIEKLNGSRGATSAFILLKASSLRWIDRLSQAGRAHAGLRCWRPRFQPRLLTSSFASQGQPGGGILTLQENEHEHDCIAATDDHGPDIGPHLHE